MQRAKAIACGALIGAIGAISMVGVASAAGGDGYYSMGPRRHHWGMALLLFLMLVAGVVLLAVFLWRNRHPLPTSYVAPSLPSPTQNAQTILADRLARGEISPDDYRAALAVLRETPPK